MNYPGSMDRPTKGGLSAVILIWASAGILGVLARSPFSQQRLRLDYFRSWLPAPLDCATSTIRNPISATRRTRRGCLLILYDKS